MTTYTLRHRTPGRAPAPLLDTSQQAVVAHEGGPLLVLAGPGTGKTTTMVEAVVDLVENRGVDPASVLALTFSRKAAEQLRDRVTARLGRTLGTSLSSTFHSFAFSLVRRYTDAEPFSAPLRLLTAPQQDVVLRQLLEPHPESVAWPEHLAEAARTRGFAREVQSLLDRARERGLTGEQLAKVGAVEGRPEWEAAGRFLEDYLTILDAESALDYADLVIRAGRLAEHPSVQAELRARYSWVFVDEYQDTDPAQVALLRSLAGDGRNLVVVGDPDQSIYGFRGADVRGILDFPAQFRTRTGAPAPVVALQTTRRFGPTLLGASRRVAAALPVAGAIPAEVFARFREPLAVEGPHGPGEVEVLHFDTARAEVEHIADRLRRAHLEEGIGWSDMAVLVRSGRTAIPGLRRALTGAGVPVEVAADDTPLTEEPAVAPLLDALRVTLHLDNDDPQHPSYVDAEKARALLCSPLGGLDAAELRRLARALHHRAKQQLDAGELEVSKVPASDELVRDALLDPSLLDPLLGDALPGGRREVEKARRLALLLRRARRLVEERASAEQVLWALWSGTSWPQHLRTVATSGSVAAAAAHRDLDAICALFEEAAKAEEQRENTTTESFLEGLGAQQLPADTLADRGVRGEAVRLLTAHRSKGLEWSFVVVASVQEGAWPDLRRRSSLLRADEVPVGHDGEEPGDPLPPTEPRVLLAEERRLFYVACTRARRRLLVTAVASPDEDGDQPSRFTGELGVTPRVVQGRPQRPLSFAGLVAELRRTVTDPASSPALRDAAVRRLARLALERHGPDRRGPDRSRSEGRGGDFSPGRGGDGEGAHPLVPAADPGQWWGTRARSLSDRPVRPVDEPLALSASALEALLGCPAKWFLEREAGGATPSTASQGFGDIVHALADRVAKDEVPATVTEEELMAHVDRVWDQMPFATPWSAVKERAELVAALRRFLTWHRGNARTLLGTEVRYTVEVTVEGQPVVLRGAVDRLELDADGHVVVVDLKTTKKAPTKAQLAEHPQLAVYQLAVARGAFDQHVPGTAGAEGTAGAGVGEGARGPGGAELVQLRDKNLAAPVKVQRQDAPTPDADGVLPVEHRLAEAVRRVRSEEFSATRGDHCRHCDFTLLCPLETKGTVLS